MPKVAAIQMCSSPDLAENLAMAENLIREAAQNQANLVVLPENFACMGLNEADKLRLREVYQKGPIQDFLSSQAKKNRLWLVGGTIPLQGQDPEKARAASLVFDDRGRCVARYDKIHLFDVSVTETEIYQESKVIEPGTELSLVSSPVGKLGLAVCYDLRFPELFRCLFNQGAEIFTLPSAFTVKTGQAHWEVLTRSRAIENLAYFIGPGQGGKHAGGRNTYGHSLIIDPWGKILAEKKDVEAGIIFADIDLSYLAQLRQALPMAKHQRIFSSLKNGGTL